MSYSVFLSHANGEDSHSLEEQLKEWGFTVDLYQDIEQAWNLLSSDHPPEIFLFEWEESGANSETALFLQTIWETRHEFPFYAVVFGENKYNEDMIEFLAAGAHDYLEKPFNEKLFKAKLDVAKQLVVDRRVLADSALIMERYARHADRVGAERTQQLVHAERLSTLGTMSAGLAHEINNPLGYITTSLETANIYWEQASNALSDEENREEIDPKHIEKILDRVPKAFERIHNGIERINKLMLGLKNFARSSQGERNEVSLNSCAEMALEMCHENIKYSIVEIHKNYTEDLPLVLLDSQQIEQVLINLLVNASHALESSKEGAVTLTTEHDGEFVELRVADNGPGIPKKKLETIWKPYYTTKEVGKGTGLGLAISKSLIRDNGGTITVRNRDEGGAEFTLRFPVRDQVS